MKRKKRYGSSPRNPAPEETLEQLRSKYPKKLIDAFVAWVKSGHNEKVYEKYDKLSQEFLGDKVSDEMAGMRLCIALHNATIDLVNKK